MIKRILVALSGTPYTPTAVRYALEVARLHAAEVTGVTLVDPRRIENVGPVPLGGASAAHELAEHRRHATEESIEEQVAAFEAACHEAGTVHRVLRETGDTLEELISCGRYHDLTIIGLRGLFDYGVLRDANTRTVKLIHSGVRPILAVAEGHRPIRRVLIAYNGSMESAKAMKRFVQMRVWPDIELAIVCFGFDAKESGALLTDAAAYCRSHGFVAETESAPGDPKAELLPYARARGADLLVLGSTGRSKIAKLILGDTALEAIRHADIPLFLSR
jgi:nucleotide-binding universal stress UspA family protein